MNCPGLTDRHEFLRFVAVGGFAALLNIVSRYFLNRVMGFSAAILIAYLIGMLAAYLLSRRYVFAATERGHGSAFVRFALVNAVSAAQVWLVSLGLARLVFPAMGMTWRADDVAHVTGVASPVVVSYFAHKFFSFSPPQTG